MYPPPEGPLESPEQIRDLDDTFLTSDPFGYFVSRIGMLHAWAGTGAGDTLIEGAPETDLLGDADGADEDGVTAEIGRPDLFPVIGAVMRDEHRSARPTDMITSAQVAVDAFALRHHVAEAVLRLFVTATERSRGSGAPTASLWSRMTDDRNIRVHELLGAVSQAASDLGEFGFGRLVLPPSATAESEADRAHLVHFVRLCAAWLERAAVLLAPADLDLNTAHNKVKHGLAVRGRADLRVEFSSVGPDADGNIPLSAFGPDVSFNIFERPVLEFMSRPRVPGRGPQGLEVTQLQLDYRHLLGESAMMAFVHGALFHVAACRHFEGRSVPRGLSVAAHPGLADQDALRPDQGGHQGGLRFPITDPPGGGEPRPAGFWHRDGTSISLTYTRERIKARVVDG